MARFDIPDHPEIQSIERTGYPSWMQEDDDPIDEDDEDALYDERREQELLGE